MELHEKIGKVVAVRQAVALVLRLSCSYFSLNCVKDLRVTKIVKQNKFEGDWVKLVAKTVPRENHGQNI